MINSSTRSPEKTASIKNVVFYGDQISTASWAEESYVALKPITEILGLDWMTQYRKITQDERYRHIPIPCQTPGGIQEMLCLPLKKLNGWLFSINPNKVRPDLKDKLIRYQEECFDVLYRYWHQPKEFPDPHASPFDRLNPSTMAELRRINPRLVHAYLVNTGITPEFINNLLTGQNLLPVADTQGVISLPELVGRLSDHAHEYDDQHLFLFQDQFDQIAEGHDRLGSLRWLRNHGYLVADENRLTRKLTVTAARCHSAGVRKNVYVFNKKVLEQGVNYGQVS